jgi:RNA polymerase-associated protein RTF1
MADIDDELLALAGEASSDEEEDAPMNISRESSGTPAGKTASKPGAKKASGKKASRRQNDSEEEGEA